MARRALAHVRERRRDAARDRADRPPRGPRRPAGRGQPPRGARRSDTTASRSLRRSRASRFPATSRERCRRWRWASPSAPAAPTTIAAAPTRSTSRTRWIAGTRRWMRFAHAIETEDKAALMDSLIICKFLRGVFEDFYAEAADMLQPGHRLGHDGGRTSRDGQAHRRHQAAVQSAGRLDAGRRHAARAVSRHPAAERSRGGAQPRAARGAGDRVSPPARLVARLFEDTLTVDRRRPGVTMRQPPRTLVRSVAFQAARLAGVGILSTVTVVVAQQTGPRTGVQGKQCGRRPCGQP